MLNFLNGYKTYIVAFFAAAFALTQWWTGAITVDQLVAALTAAAGLAGLRSGVATSVLNAVTAMHLLNAPQASVASAKAAAQSALAVAKKAAPIFALCFGIALVAPMLSACNTTSSGTTLAAAETITDTAQNWWITNCINAKTFAFCSDPATIATVKQASQTATDAAQTATDAVTVKTLDAATIATLVADANADANALAALIAALQGKH